MTNQREGFEKCEPDTEVSHVDVLPDSKGMYEHRFLFNDRLCAQTELYLYNPNKAQPREWVGLSNADISEASNTMSRYTTGYDFARAIEAKLKQLNKKG